MTPDKEKKLMDSVARIEQGLFGDDQLDQWGVIRRVKNHDKRLTRLERAAIYVSAGAATVGVLYMVVTDWAPLFLK